jgi:hypothetical protein
MAGEEKEMSAEDGSSHSDIAVTAPSLRSKLICR